MEAVKGKQGHTEEEEFWGKLHRRANGVVAAVMVTHDRVNAARIKYASVFFQADTHRKQKNKKKCLKRKVRAEIKVSNERKPLQTPRPYRENLCLIS